MTRQLIIDHLGQSINTNLKENLINRFLGPGDSFDDNEVLSKLDYIFNLSEDLVNNPLNNIYFLAKIVNTYKLLNKTAKHVDNDNKYVFYAEKRKIIRFLIYKNFLKSFSFDRTVDQKDHTQVSLLLNFSVLDQSWRLHEFVYKETINLLHFKGYDIDMKDVYRLNSIISKTGGEIDRNNNVHTDKYKVERVDKKELVVKTAHHQYVVSDTKIRKAPKRKAIQIDDFQKSVMLLHWYNLAIESTGFFDLYF